MITVQHNSDLTIDSSAAWLDALNLAKLNNDLEIFFPKGTYHFYTGTKLKHFFISNNDESVKNIVFYLNGMKNLKIYGDDAKFIFHGRLLPFVLEECTNISISGISIDFAMPFHFETTLLDTDGTSSLLRVPGVWHIENGKLVVFDDGLDVITNKMILNCYSKETGEIVRPGGYHVPNKNLVCEKENELLRLPIGMDIEYPNLFLRHQARHTPGILIDRCLDTTIENVTIHHAEGMAIVGQNSRNICLDNIKVIPNPTRDLSVTDDAVHLSECEGKIEIKNSTFLETLDDAINVHGMYRRLKKIGETVLMEACHFQQFGLWDGKDGDLLELVKAETLQPYGQVRCKSFSPGTRQLYCLELEDDLPSEFENGDIVRIMRSSEMDVEIVNNVMANNMSRGILLSGAKRALIKDNKIHSPGNGIYISGDANYWFESGPVKNLEICGNTFDYCAYLHKEAVPINIDPVILKKVSNFFYHGSIDIHNNIFKTQDSSLVLKANSAAKISFQNNEFITPTGAKSSIPIEVDCGNLIQ